MKLSCRCGKTGFQNLAALIGHRSNCHRARILDAREATA